METVRQVWAEFDLTPESVYYDPEDTDWRWRVDIITLAGNLHCYYGSGCPGLGSGSAHGCCVDGAYMDDVYDDIALVEDARQNMPDELWQNAKYGRKRGVVVQKSKDMYKTRVYRGACIFSNGADHQYPGCSLHHWATQRGEHHTKTKPLICWLAPLITLIDDDVKTISIGPFRNRDWINKEGFGYTNEDEPWDWWCVDDPETYTRPTAGTPAYRGWEHELRKLMGDSTYESLAAMIESMMPTLSQSVPIDLIAKPHPPTVQLDEV